MDSGRTVTGKPRGQESGPYPTQAHHIGGSHQGPAISKGSIPSMSDNTTYTVAGMTCVSCATKVTQAVSDLDAVTDLDVDLATGTLTLTGPVEQEQVRKAVTAAGYQVS